MDGRKVLLIVDDGEVNRASLNAIFEDNYECLDAENGSKALEILEKRGKEIKAVLLDLIIPVMDGYQTMEEMKKRDLLSKVPVIIITADNSTESELKAFDAGASDVIIKPFEPTIVMRRVENVLKLNETREEQEMLIQKQADKIRHTTSSIIEALASASETRSLETGTHVRRVGMYVKALLEYVMQHYPDYNLTDHRITVIANASSLHDIGKIGIPDAILNKPGRLTPEEFDVIKTHTVKGGQILASLTDSADTEYISSAYNIAMYHHERWTGRGYPEGRKGNDIPLEAQAVGVADCYDALTNDRVYKKAIPSDEAVRMILNGECGEFSPVMMEALSAVKGQFVELTSQYAGKE
ncbi:MAG: response regulator [Lachnospiraceae bacterium]|jgi:response regulator RpfG family c-di-GMP phosphodiesterase|nr:response regulator [Lachnospiraceae bacterium]